MEKGLIYRILAGVMFVTFIVSIVTYNMRTLTPLSIYTRLQDYSGIMGSPSARTGQLASTVDSCRLEALNTLFRSSSNRSIHLDDSLQQARKCWQEALVFYLNYPLDNTFGSHVIPLLASLWATDGAILELGSGWHSTPMVHRLSSQQNRQVLTSDGTYAWLKKFIFLASDRHDLFFVDTNNTQAKGNLSEDVHVVSSWGAIGEQQQHWGCIFVDHAPAMQRIVELQRLRNNADLLVVHDTEPNHDRVYRVQKLLNTFNYRTIFGKGWTNTFTDIVSDSHRELVHAVKTLCEWGIEVKFE